MTIDILVTQAVELPDIATLLSLAQKIREKWKMGPDAPVSLAEIFITAKTEGILALPANYRIEEAFNEAYTDDELRELTED